MELWSYGLVVELWFGGVMGVMVWWSYGSYGVIFFSCFIIHRELWIRRGSYGSYARELRLVCGPTCLCRGIPHNFLVFWSYWSVYGVHSSHLFIRRGMRVVWDWRRWWRRWWAWHSPLRPRGGVEVCRERRTDRHCRRSSLYVHA